ncbi:hypothetical protein BDR26DRAFT_892135 [Obelidium mucronatum]|nr:hypothetical protein BDR26DRAFT_892135 [Obelidium mucronatum]
MLVSTREATPTSTSDDGPVLTPRTSARRAPLLFKYPDLENKKKLQEKVLEFGDCSDETPQTDTPIWKLGSIRRIQVKGSALGTEKDIKYDVCCINRDQTSSSVCYWSQKSDKKGSLSNIKDHLEKHHLGSLPVEVADYVQGSSKCDTRLNVRICLPLFCNSLIFDAFRLTRLLFHE